MTDYTELTNPQLKKMIRTRIMQLILSDTEDDLYPGKVQAAHTLYKILREIEMHQ